jgi:transposase
MAGQSPVRASAEQRSELLALSQSRERGEADRARAILLTLAGWTSPRIAEAFGVREDTVRLWRSEFMRSGIAVLKRSVAPGPAPVKAERALAVAEELLSGPVADRPNWTLPRLSSFLQFAPRIGQGPSVGQVRETCLADEIKTRSGVRLSRSRLSIVLRKRGIFAGGGHATP